MRILLLLALLLLGCGCLNKISVVKRYQQSATEKCEQSHSPEACKPLTYPACDENGCHQ